MKTINIYLTKQEYDKCKQIQNKYRVSLSALADKVIYETYRSLLKNGLENSKELFNTYLGKGTKTSLKVRCLNEVLDQNIEKRHKNKFATNCLKIYLSKDIKKYIKTEGINHYYTNIDKELTKCIDPNWDYNQRLRAQIRIVKENKEYFKKVLEQ